MSKTHTYFLSNNSQKKLISLCDRLFSYDKKTLSFNSKFIQILPNNSNPHIIINSKAFSFYDKENLIQILSEVLHILRFVLQDPKAFEKELREILENVNKNSVRVKNELDSIKRY